MNAEGYEWVTSDMFDGKLEDICDMVGTEAMLAIPGVYELCAEHFNNEVLAALEEARERETETESETP